MFNLFRLGIETPRRRPYLLILLYGTRPCFCSAPGGSEKCESWNMSSQKPNLKFHEMLSISTSLFHVSPVVLVTDVRSNMVCKSFATQTKDINFGTCCLSNRTGLCCWTVYSSKRMRLSPLKTHPESLTQNQRWPISTCKLPDAVWHVPWTKQSCWESSWCYLQMKLMKLLRVRCYPQSEVANVPSDLCWHRSRPSKTRFKRGSKLMLVRTAKGADFRNPLGERRRHGRRRVFILEIIGPRSHIDSMRWQFLLDMSDTDSPRRVALGSCEENIGNELRMWDLGTHNCWGNARRAGPIGPISVRSSETAAVSLWTVRNSTSTLVSGSVVCRRHFSCLTCLTKAVHGAAWNTSAKGFHGRQIIGQMTETAWDNNFGTFPRQAKAPLHCGWRRARKICHWPWNVKSTIRKAGPRNTTKRDCIWNTGRHLQLFSFTFLHCTPKVVLHFSCTRLCCRHLLSHGPNK